MPRRVPDAEIEEDVTFGDEPEDPEYGLEEYNLDDSESDDEENVTDSSEDYFADF